MINDSMNGRLMSPNVSPNLPPTHCLSSFWIDKPAIFSPMYGHEVRQYKSKVEAWPLKQIWREPAPVMPLPSVGHIAIASGDTPQRLKAARKLAADETVSILRTGKYNVESGEQFDITGHIQTAISSSLCYSPDHDFSDIKVTPRYKSMDVEVINECTLRACRDIYESYGEEVGCLCFASGKNPGGAFLGGSDGQEESIARSSAYYHCVIKDPSLYEFNRLNKDPFQSDHLIVVPHMPVFRNDSPMYGLCAPWFLTSISAPAVNASLVRERHIPEAEQKIGQRMRVRVRRILMAAYKHNVRNLVLGEYGCGSLGNDPNEVSFTHQLNLLNNNVCLLDCLFFQGRTYACKFSFQWGFRARRVCYTRRLQHWDWRGKTASEVHAGLLAGDLPAREKTGVLQRRDAQICSIIDM